MGKLSRRFAGVVGIVLFSFLALPLPAQACYACQPVQRCVDFPYGGWWCGFIVECIDQGSPCSMCYPGCIEGFDTCGHIGPPCQFASKSQAPNLDRLASIEIFAPPLDRQESSR